ncbi:Uncharacterised protein [Shigella sonnei]|nr:Uncharacterised protein [Shigella sonnei]
MPDHVVQADCDAAIVLVNDLIVIARHPAHAPVIFDIFTG